MGGQWASPTQGPWPFHPRTLAGGKGQGAGQVEAETLSPEEGEVGCGAPFRG